MIEIPQFVAVAPAQLQGVAKAFGRQRPIFASFCSTKAFVHLAHVYPCLLDDVDNSQGKVRGRRGPLATVISPVVYS